jgi:hypothetical protein
MIPGQGLMPKDASGVWWLANIYHKSGMLPKGLESRERAFMAVQFGLELGLTPTESLRSVMVVNNRPALYGDAPLGLIRKSGLMADFEERVEGNGDRMAATCRAKRKDQDSWFEASFSMGDAKAAGLLDGKSAHMYKRYPQRMLKYRARAFCLRDAFPDVLMGAHMAEELEEVRSERGDKAEVMGGDELTEALAAKAAVIEEVQGGEGDTAEVQAEPQTGHSEGEAQAAPEAQAGGQGENEEPAVGDDLFDRPPTDQELADQPPFDPEV